ncbi:MULTISPECIES: hypothetical protein [Nostocales]|uniref:hypothetical protein n=1 Tax=Nostocales TaxID=1161 RepID=UPI00029B67D8|nr:MULTISPECIES: hypothetical protein [Nostocales]MBO1051318.1 hypothetical protein [Dolichospermum sp. DET73]AFW92827.1 type II restriction enzyme [Anabaena sp. 90]MTJ17751.1 hypothetical protein [Dolichospermum sp. UHCC 0299]MTJ22202.1 hypothetical protein [Dolichospermum sp. UHCC 0352]MTJ38099.1 hypothetical protein [Dolichospermum sp. UHCC 0406]
MSYTFSQLSRLYDENKFFELTSSPEGLYFLKLRSLARKDYYLHLFQKAQISSDNLGVKQYLETLFKSNISLETIHDSINQIYEIQREERRIHEQDLLAELYKLRVFDWGGIHQNDINKYLVDNYIKKITNYDNLIEKVKNEILHSLKGFVLCSWYNNWTSIIIEDIFKDHERVLPTVGLIKQVDFFIDDIPFDLKVTYFPKGFMENERRNRKLTIKELSELKKTAKIFNLPFDQNRPDDELLIDLITAFAESSQQDVKDFYDNFVKIRRDIINNTLKQPRELLRWLYENQGSQRFDASNRLFLVLVDTNSLEDSWKLKRDYTLLKNKIDEYLNTRSFNKDKLLLNWSFNNNQYQSYADVLFVLK